MMLPALTLLRIFEDTQIPIEVMLHQWGEQRLRNMGNKVRLVPRRRNRMKVYVAAPFIHAGIACEVGKMVEARGGSITMPWWTFESDGAKSLQDPTNHEFYKIRAEEDLQGVLDADAIIVLCPEPGVLPAGRGMWWECGIALAQDISIYLVPLKNDGPPIPTPGTVFDFLGIRCSLADALNKIFGEKK